MDVFIALTDLQKLTRVARLLIILLEKTSRERTSDYKRKKTKHWKFNGLTHRVGGPALEYADGGRVWYQGGLHHREDGPAVIRADGQMGWHRNGVRHRDADDPAVINSNEDNSYYICGEYMGLFF